MYQLWFLTVTFTLMIEAASSSYSSDYCFDANQAKPTYDAEVPCFYKPGDLVIAGLYNLHHKIPNTERCDFDKIDYEEALLSETHWYALNYLNDHPMLKGWSVDYVFSKYTDVQSNDGHHPIMVNPVPSAFATVTSAGTTQAKALSLCTQGFCLPTTSFWATSQFFDNTTKYPFFLRTISSDKFAAAAIVALLAKLRWFHITVIYEDTDYGYNMKQSLDEQIFIDNGLPESTASLCVEQYIDVQMNNWDSLTERLILNPASTHVVVILALSDVAKGTIRFIRNKLRELGHDDKSNHRHRYRFVLTDIDRFTDDDFADGLDVYMNHSIVIDKPLVNRTNPWAIQALQYKHGCCWKHDYPLTSVCYSNKAQTIGQPAFNVTYCTGEESFVDIVDDGDEFFKTSRLAFDAIHVIGHAVIALLDNYCPADSVWSGTLCAPFKDNVTGVLVLDTIVNLINNKTYEDPNETMTCNGKSMLFVNGTMSAAPSYRISTLINSTWHSVGSFEATTTNGYPVLTLNASLVKKPDHTTCCTNKCPWYKVQCPDAWIYIPVDGNDTDAGPVPVSTTCCGECLSACYLQFQVCLSIPEDRSDNSYCDGNVTDQQFQGKSGNHARCVYGPEYCARKAKYRYKVNCYCPKIILPADMINDTGVLYYGYADDAELHRWSGMEITFIVLACCLTLLCLLILRMLIVMWSTPLITHSGPIVTVFQVFVKIGIFACLPLLSVVADGQWCNGALTTVSMLYASAFACLLVKSIYLAMPEVCSRPCDRLRSYLKLTRNQSVMVSEVIILFVLIGLQALVFIVYYSKFALSSYDDGVTYRINATDHRLAKICVFTLSPNFLILTVCPMIYHVLSLYFVGIALRSNFPYRVYQARFMIVGWLATLCAYCGFYIVYSTSTILGYRQKIPPDGAWSTCIAKKDYPWYRTDDNNQPTVPVPHSAEDFMSACSIEYDSVYSENDTNIVILWQLINLLIGMLLLCTTTIPIVYLVLCQPELNDVGFTTYERRRSNKSSAKSAKS